MGDRQYKGLTSQQVQEKQKREGYNELPRGKKRTTIDTLLDVMHEPMFILLLLCGGTYLFVGELNEALMLLAFVFAVIGITVYQERKVERALEALRDLSSPRARVMRDGKQVMVAGIDVVRDDIILLSEGDRVPADAVVLSCSNFMVNESLLTGEPVPVRKAEWDEKIHAGFFQKCSEPGELHSDGKQATARPGGDDLPFVYSSTLVVQGHAIARAISIGMNTEIGKIGKVLQQEKEEKTSLQKETEKIVKVFGTIGITICVLITVIYTFTRGSFVDGFLAGLALAMAILPEEFPVVLAIFLALGAWRMSKSNVLTRRLHSIQNLGAATVLCVDKTGTLTINMMTLRKIYYGGKFHELREGKKVPGEFHPLLEFGILASQRSPFDPMEQSLMEMKNGAIDHAHVHDNWKLVKEYPLSRELLALSHVWRSKKDEYVIAAKGAPEAIIDLCHMSANDRKKVLENVTRLSEQGLRVLGVAKASSGKKGLPKSQHDFKFEFLGLLGFEDPVRKTVPSAVAQCQSAGIRVIMITGDYPGTAKHIAKKSGFANCERIITGAELEAMTDAELAKKIGEVGIFARTLPEQKLRIVDALKRNNEVVVMTGDGVNDAPALKSANVGIAMGARGTEVARESAAFVLLDDDFSSIVMAVRMGRRIYDNIKKAMSYIIAVHIPIAGMAFVPILLKWPIVLFPVHIAFLEIIIDPVCSIAFEAEPEEKDIMSRKPRRHNEPLFDRKSIAMSVLQGLIVFAFTLAVFRVALDSGETENQARALSFLTLVIGNMGMILTNRSWNRSIIQTFESPNPALGYILAAIILALAAILYVPFLQSLFGFSTLYTEQIIFSVLCGVLSVAWAEFFKFAGKTLMGKGVGSA